MKPLILLLTNMLLHHVNDIPKALSEVNRVLKTGGIFYCATFGENRVVDLFGKFI